MHYHVYPAAKTSRLSYTCELKTMDSQMTEYDRSVWHTSRSYFEHRTQPHTEWMAKSQKQGSTNRKKILGPAR